MIGIYFSILIIPLFSPHKCSEPAILEDARGADTGCAERSRKIQGDGCNECAAGSFDERSMAGLNPDQRNICVAKTKHCKTLVTGDANLIGNGQSCVGNINVCNLAEGPRVARNIWVNNEAGDGIIQQWTDAATYVVGVGGAKFMHVTNAADAIIASQELRASLGGSAGGQNSPQAKKNCKGFVYLWAVNNGLSVDDLKAKAVSYRNNVAKTMAEIEGSLDVILVNAPAGYTVEYDPDQNTAVRHFGSVTVGNGLTLEKMALPAIQRRSNRQTNALLARLENIVSTDSLTWLGFFAAGILVGVIITILSYRNKGNQEAQTPLL